MEGGRVSRDDCFGQGVELASLFLGEAFHAPEVEKGDRAVLVKEVVTRVRVGVEQAVALEAGPHEAVDHLAPPVAELLGALEGRLPPPAVDHLHREHPG